GQAHAAILVLLGDRNHEAQIRANQLLHRMLVAGARAVAELDLLGRSQQAVGADLLEILIETRLVLLRDLRESFAQARGLPLPLSGLSLCRGHIYIRHFRGFFGGGRLAYSTRDAYQLPCKTSAGRRS